MKYTQIIACIALMATVSLKAGAADAAEKAVGYALKAAALKPDTGCNTLGSLGGRNLKTLLVSQENQLEANILCCDNEKFKTAHPRAFESLCKGTSTNKATELLINNLNLKADLTCPKLLEIGRGLSALTDDQKQKVCTKCDGFFDNHPKAKEAVCIEQEESAE